ncbi:MAG: copper-translocating P-type ATPase [Bacteroidetes bacterium GWF2_41_9]|nr:MAG: copper-translocating P-type ATPase [Bacteroidetes bacterium GWA2_40_15]OFY01664.1 MAG: copper-translocating P-type ATPase [Bacteroidetes bacterium GWC2_40_22]OFY57220.1 MAG: copper-translocating P-type ATPase [Bacteroidetes bacterium GWF2_41_9]HAM09953.1 heavy metal translocating P-type ATPase [Bacteroidales bacterium]HBH84296.1 heavy metal translocating P-type ATPase [Bacteroidales bacterium]
MNNPQEKSVKKQFPVTGLSCASCASNVELKLNNHAGVVQAAVNLASQIATIEYLPSKVKPADLKESIVSIGYDLIIDESARAKEELENLQQKRIKSLRRRTFWSISLSFPLVTISMFFMNMPYANFIMWAIATPIVIWMGRSFFINGWRQLMHRSANMDTLVALSTGIAYLFSVFNTLFPEFWHERGLHAHVYFEAAGVVIALILVGKLLEEGAKANTSSAIKKLIGLQPKTVIKVAADGSTKEFLIATVKVGDIMLIKPGEKIPVDGIVTQGNSYVDESLISGEPVPVIKEPGTVVFAGTINQKGSFHFRAEKVGADTLLSGIIRMVQEAQGSKAPVQKLVDKVALIFVPTVVVISLITLAAWMIFGGENGSVQGVMSMVTVLVIACPCALGLATPTAIMVGIGKGAESNILIKDAEALEQTYKMKALLLDKTGTITEGKPTVEQIEWLSAADKDKNINILFSLEKASEHPLADAIVANLKAVSASLILDDIQSITGKGITAKYKDVRYYAGGSRLMGENKLVVNNELEILAARWEAEARSIVYFADSTKVLAAISVTDPVKKNSAQAIKELKEMGIEVYMVTGDNEKTAAAVAEMTGVNGYKSDMLPSDKADFIKSLQKDGKITGMVGDGINDSQALATADVSIAMGKGSDIAIDAAKMTIISSDLSLIPVAIRLSRNTVKTIRQNLFWAFIYNIIGIPLAAGVLFPINGFLLNPMIAGAAMALSSISVVSNSLRLKWSG